MFRCGEGLRVPGAHRRLSRRVLPQLGRTRCRLRDARRRRDGYLRHRQASEERGGHPHSCGGHGGIAKPALTQRHDSGAGEAGGRRAAHRAPDHGIDRTDQAGGSRNEAIDFLPSPATPRRFEERRRRADSGSGRWAPCRPSSRRPPSPPADRDARIEDILHDGDILRPGPCDRSDAAAADDHGGHFGGFHRGLRSREVA